MEPSIRLKWSWLDFHSGHFSSFDLEHATCFPSFWPLVFNFLYLIFLLRWDGSWTLAFPRVLFSPFELSHPFLGLIYNQNRNGSYLYISRATFSWNWMHVYNHPPRTSNLDAEHTQHWTLPLPHYSQIAPSSVPIPTPSSRHRSLPHFTHIIWHQVLLILAPCGSLLLLLMSNFTNIASI